MDKNSENTQEQQLNEPNERIFVLEKKCKQLEEINAIFCDEDEQRCNQIDAIEKENRELKKDNAFKAKQIQQEREENKQLKEALEKEQKKAEEMRSAVRIGFKASRMKSPSGASTASSCSRSSSSTAGFASPVHSLAAAASSFGKHKISGDLWSPSFTPKQNSNTSSIVSFSSNKNTSTLCSSSSSQRLDDEDCNLGNQLRAFIDVEQFNSNGEQREKDSDVFDVNIEEGRDSGTFSDQDQQGVSGEVFNVPAVGKFDGMSLAEELMLAEQHQQQNNVEEPVLAVQHQQQNNVEEPVLAVQHQQQNNVEALLAVQYQQQNIVEEPELAVQHQQQNNMNELLELAEWHQQQNNVEAELAVQHQQQNNIDEQELAEQQNNNSNTPRGARPRLHFFLLLLLFVLVVVVFVLIVVLPSVLRGQLVMRIPVFFASWLREYMLRGTNVVVHTEVMWHSNGLFGGGDY